MIGLLKRAIFRSKIARFSFSKSHLELVAKFLYRTVDPYLTKKRFPFI
ncbi:MAG: hypothetical protein K0R59_4138 [Sphingobacterium sp.]|jgi:hypothetical protein|nr:hypothetical protein [Sphingobacterium sp.]